MADGAVIRHEIDTRGVLALVVVSVLLHVGGFMLLAGGERPAAKPSSKPMELVVIDVVETPPPPVKEEPKVEPPKPVIEVVKPKVKPKRVKPPEIKVAETTQPPPPVEDAPPPPNETPPAETPPTPAPLVVGISMSSTSTAGSFKAPVGNTLYGRNAEKATAPTEVKQYAAPKYVPHHQADEMPRVIGEVRIDYPREARRNEIEGVVRLKVTIDWSGKVVAAKVISGLGYGLDEAALEAVKRFRWKPATKNGEAVSTEITYAYRFLLD